MRFQRRQLLQLTGAAAAALALSSRASAADYPTHPVRIIVPFAAGGGTDLSARLVGQWLTERLGQQFVIENRTGGSGHVGVEAVVRAPADGYTLLVVTVTAAIDATLYDTLSYNFVRDIAPVASIIRVPLLMQVNASLPVRTVPEFIAYAKAHPDQVSMGSGGIGSPAHVAGELFKTMTGVSMVHVPYRGASLAIADLLGGQIQVTFTEMTSSIEYVRAGKLRALAVTTAMRSEALPDVPTVGDFVPGFEAGQWFGLCAPRNTPPEIIQKLNGQINAALADPKLKSRFAEVGGSPLPGSSADFTRLIDEETQKWGKVIKLSGAKPS